MLTISPAISVNNLPTAFGKTNYILFPDSENKDLYYALAERPSFMADQDGKPSFNLTWYFGGGVNPGGICTMTVALPMPDLAQPAVRETIAAALTKNPATIKIAQSIDALCRAMDAKQTERVNALKAELGYSDEMVRQKLAVFDKNREWTQFLPATVGLDIRPIPFKSGTVTVQAFAGKQTYIDGTPEYTSGQLTVTPSLFNSNAAVVTFNLQELGANLFWHGLGGPELATGDRPKGYDAVKGGSSVIAVRYTTTFDGLLPQAKATVTFDHSVVAKLNVETEVARGSWGRTYLRLAARGKEYEDLIGSTTEIVLPSAVAATKDDKESVQKILTDWAAKQLEDMLKAQLPSVKLEDLDINGARKLSTASKQSRTYTLTQAIEVPKNPQGQLPKISALVVADKLGEHFQLIDLNQRPYFNVDVTIQPPSLQYLKKRNIDRFVVTQISYAHEKLRDTDGKEVGLLEYPVTEQQKEVGRTLKGTFSKQTSDKSLRYAYLVSYTDGTPTFRTTVDRQDGGDNYVALGGVDLGVLSVSFDGIDLPWDLISSATVDLQYGDWQKRATLRRDDTLTIVKPFGKAMTGTLTYKLTLNLTAGAPFVDTPRTVTPAQGNADITLLNPLGDAISTLTFALADGVTQAQLRVEYTLKGLGQDRVFTRTLMLDASKPETTMPTWKVPVFRSTPSSFRVVKARITAGRGAVDLTDLSSGTIGQVEDDTQITVESDGFSVF